MRITSEKITHRSLQAPLRPANGDLEKIIAGFSVAAVNVNSAVTESNRQAAASLIRDLECASQSMTQTNHQIRSQSVAALLSQSSIMPTSVLSLLQG